MKHCMQTMQPRPESTSDTHTVYIWPLTAHGGHWLANSSCRCHAPHQLGSAFAVCNLQHEDMRETGYKAFGLLPGLLSGDLVLKRHLERLPMTLPTTTTDPGFPHHRVNELCHKLEAHCH